MKPLGCVRQIDKLGRLVLPSDIRQSLDIKDGVDAVEFFVEGDKVIISKYQPSCMFCNSSNDIVKFKDKLICKKCISEMEASFL